MLKPRVILLGKLAITAAAIWYLLAKVDLSTVLELAIGISPAILAAGIALLLLHIVVCAVRWALVVRAIGGRLAVRDACVLFCIANFFGQVLPGGIGSDAIRVWKTHRGGMPLRVALTSVALDRLVALLGLVLLVATIQPALQTRPPDDLKWLFPALAVAGVAGIAGLGLLDRFALAHNRFALVRAAHALAADVRSVFFKPRNAVAVVVVSLLSHVNLALVVWVLALGLGVNLPVLDTIVLFSQVLVVSMLPISIAGWGVREAAMVVLFGSIGVSAAHSLTISMLFGIGTIVTALPGGVIWLISKERLPPPVPPLEELADSPIADSAKP
jgi:glycosyltransferase 2 family protein